MRSLNWRNEKYNNDQGKKKNWETKFDVLIQFANGPSTLLTHALTPLLLTQSMMDCNRRQEGRKEGSGQLDDDHDASTTIFPLFRGFTTRGGRREIVNKENGGGWNYEERKKKGGEDRGGGDYTRARERNGRLKRTLNGRENANEADYSQICFEFVYTEHRPRCFIFNAAAASRFRGLAALAPRGWYPGYNGRVSCVSSCQSVICWCVRINSSECFQCFVKYFRSKRIWQSLFDFRLSNFSWFFPGFINRRYKSIRIFEEGG